MDKKLVWLMASIGMIIGGWLPTLFGAGDLSLWSLLGGLVGGVAAIFLTNRYLL